MAEALKTLNTNKYAQYLTEVTNKYRRLAEISQQDLTRIDHQMVQWLLGAISGDDALQTEALTELASIYDEAITPPSSVIGTTPTDANTRRGYFLAVNAGSNVITFSSAMTTTTYSLFYNVYTASGGQVQVSVDPASRTTAGFTIVCASGGRLDYFAIEN